MAKIKIEIGNPRVDGDYELDLSYFTNRELHVIKREAGVLPMKIEEALIGGDTDVVVALALIALARAGRSDVPADAIWDAKAGAVLIDFGDEDAADEGDAVPPVSEPAETAAAPESPPSSGVVSSNGGASLLAVPSPTGTAG